MNIIITGASSGIGQGLKKHYEAKGHKVIGISRTNDDYTCDVSDRIALEQVFKSIGEKYGKIDILINNAGYGVLGAIETVPLADAKAIYEVNIIGVVNCIQLALPLMSEHGKIVNISSVAAFFPTPYRGYYGSSKAAVSMLTDSLRMELSQTKIQVTAICPSEIKTNFQKNRVVRLGTNERYGKAVEKSSKVVTGRDKKRMPLEKGIKIITKWIDKKHLKPQYIMGFKFKCLYRISHLIPKSWYLGICNRHFNKRK